METRKLKYIPGYTYVYLAKYKGRKFVIEQKQNSGNVKGVRFDINNIKAIAIDIRLSAREKQQVLHKLITGRNVKKELHKYKASIWIV